MITKQTSPQVLVKFSVMALILINFVALILIFIIDQLDNLLAVAKWTGVLLIIIISFISSLGYDAKVSNAGIMHVNAQERSHSGPLMQLGDTNQLSNYNAIITSAIIATLIMFLADWIF